MKEASEFSRSSTGEWSGARLAPNAKERKCLIQWQAGVSLDQEKLAAWAATWCVASLQEASRHHCATSAKQADTTEHRLRKVRRSTTPIEFMPKGSFARAMSKDPLSFMVQRGWMADPLLASRFHRQLMR
jgi:hypothetical protein